MDDLEKVLTIFVVFILFVMGGIISSGINEHYVATGKHTDYAILNIFANDGYFTVFYIENNTTKNVDVYFDNDCHLNETRDYLSFVQYRYHMPWWGLIDIQGNTTVAELYLTTETFQKLDGLGGK